MDSLPLLSNFRRILSSTLATVQDLSKLMPLNIVHIINTLELMYLKVGFDTADVVMSALTVNQRMGPDHIRVQHLLEHWRCHANELRHSEGHASYSDDLAMRKELGNLGRVPLKFKPLAWQQKSIDGGFSAYTA